MPASSGVLRAPYALYETVGHEFTRHARGPKTRPAAKDKQRDIRLEHGLITLNAIPQDGGRKLHSQKQPSLLDVALSIGLKWAESACRLLRRPGKSFIEVLGTRGRNKYRWSLPEKPGRTYKSVDFQAASARELVRSPEIAKYFADDVEKISKVNYIAFPAIGNHPSSPLGPADRMVFNFIALRKRVGGETREFGLFVRDENAKRWKSGSVQLTQEFIGSKLGLHRDTVRRSLRRLAAEWTDRKGNVHHGLGVLKFIGKPGSWQKHGAEVPKGTPGAIWQQDEPNEYIGICDWAETEKQRYDHAMEALHATRSEWATVMDQVFEQTRLEWLEEGRQVGTFQRECWKRMSEAGIPEKILEQIFPRPPS
jgi:hypothetical protein